MSAIGASLAAWLLCVAPAPSEPEASPDAELSERDTVRFRAGQVVAGRVVHVEPARYVVFVPEGTSEPRAIHWGQIESFEVEGVVTVVTPPGKPSVAELARRSDEIERQHNVGAALAYVGYGFLSAAVGGWTGYAVARRGDSSSQGLWLGIAAVTTNAGLGLATVGGVVLFRAKKRRAALREVIVAGGPLRRGAGLTAALRF